MEMYALVDVDFLPHNSSLARNMHNRSWVYK